MYITALQIDRLIINRRKGVKKKKVVTNRKVGVRHQVSRKGGIFMIVRKKVEKKTSTQERAKSFFPEMRWLSGIGTLGTKQNEYENKKERHRI